jgi:hypothetical protein
LPPVTVSSIALASTAHERVATAALMGANAACGRTLNTERKRAQRVVTLQATASAPSDGAPCALLHSRPESRGAAMVTRWEALTSSHQVIAMPLALAAE